MLGIINYFLVLLNLGRVIVEGKGRRIEKEYDKWDEST